MTKVETLTAYKCSFSYLQRNNPLIEEQRESIKNGESPSYGISEFFTDYINDASKLVIGENADRAILLTPDGLTECKLSDEVTRWHIVPRAGKQGKPVTVIKTSTKKEYNFGADSAALYSHNIFLYQNSESIIALFHRQNGSGCKSVFLETANRILKAKGLKLDMDLYIPTSDTLSTAIPTKITLKYTRNIVSSDIADNLSKKRKKIEEVRILGLNLKVEENKNIFNIFRKMQSGDIDQETAFAQIKAETADEEYNDADIQLQIGKNKRTVKWDEFEKVFGSYDITIKLHERLIARNDFSLVLTELADEYYKKIIKSEGTE